MQTEKQIESYLRKQAEKKGGRAYKFVSPGNAGVPDRIVVLPKGRVVFVELKGPHGHLTALQLNAIARLQILGCEAYVVRTKEEADRILAGPVPWEAHHEV